MRFNVRDAVQSAASIIEGQLQGKQDAMQALQKQQQQAFQNRLSLFQFGREGEEANRRVLADLLPNLTEGSQPGALNTITAPSRYSPEALSRPGPLDLAGGGGASSFQYPPGATSREQRDFFAPYQSSGATPTTPPASGGGGASTSASPAPFQWPIQPFNAPATPPPGANAGQAFQNLGGVAAAIGGQLNQIQAGQERMRSSFLADPATRTAMQGMVGNLPGGQFLAQALGQGEPAGGGVTAPPLTGGPSGQGSGPQQPDVKQSKITAPLQPLQPGGGPAPAGGPAGTAVPEGVPFTYQGAGGPQTGYYQGGQQKFAQQAQDAYNAQQRLVAGVNTRGATPELQAQIDANAGALFGQLNTPAAVNKFWAAYTRVAPLLGHDPEADKEAAKGDPQMRTTIGTYLARQFQSPGELASARAAWKAFRESPANKEFFDRNPTYKTLDFPDWSTYKKPTSQVEDEKARVELRRAQSAEQWDKGNRKRLDTIHDLDILNKRQEYRLRQIRGAAGGQKGPSFENQISPWKSRLSQAEENLKRLQSQGWGVGDSLDSVHRGTANDQDRAVVQALHEVEQSGILMIAHQKILNNRMNNRKEWTGLTPTEEQAILRERLNTQGAGGVPAKTTIKEQPMAGGKR